MKPEINSKKKSRFWSAIEDEIRSMGIDIETMQETASWSKAQRRKNIKVAEVLMEKLSTTQDRSTKLAIVSLLGAAWGDRRIAPFLIAEFLSSKTPHDLRQMSYAWTVGDALTYLPCEDVADEMLAIAGNSEFGRSREMLIVALGNISEQEKVVPVLLKLLEDEEVNGHAAMALGKLKERKAIPLLEQMLTHSVPWKRKEAERALRRIGKGPS